MLAEGQGVVPALVRLVGIALDDLHLGHPVGQAQRRLQRVGEAPLDPVPTNQPVEQLIALRSIPGLITLRPADANEVVEAWRVIIGLKHQPACLVLSRQPLPTIDRRHYASAAGTARGAYVLADAGTGRPEVILMGTGSEVALCIAAFEALEREGISARVVSMPSWELFERQEQAYRDDVFPPDVTARVSVEEGSVIGWDRYAGGTGAKIGMHTFGSSAPIKDLLTKFGFEPEKVLAAAKQQLALARGKTARGKTAAGKTARGKKA